MGAMYAAVFDGISVSAIADLFYLKPHANRSLIVHEIRITQETSETSEQLPLKLFRTATDNSAQGTSNTPNPLNPSSQAAGATCRTNITGANLATETTLLRVEAENVLGGWHYLPTPECRPVIAAGGNGFVAKLKTAPGAALTLSGVMVFEEVG